MDLDNKPAAEFARAFSQFSNGGRLHYPDAVALCLRDHPTNQQGMMRFCIAFIEGMAKQRTDARNEAAAAFAKKVIANIDARDRTLPLI